MKNVAKAKNIRVIISNEIPLKFFVVLIDWLQ